MSTDDETNVEQLQKLVTCSICNEYYQDPRILPCLHTFCLECIKKTITNGVFNCLLKDNTEISQDSIEILPVNISIQRMINLLSSINLLPDKTNQQQCQNCEEWSANSWCEKCNAYYCEVCVEKVHSNKALQWHSMTPSTEKMLLYCNEHSDEKLKYWCKQCELIVCRDCLLFQHKDHPSQSLKDAAAEMKPTFQNAIEKSENIKINLMTFVNTSKQIMNEQCNLVKQKKQEIEQVFDKLKRLLEKNKQNLIKTELIATTQKHQKLVDQQLNLAFVQKCCLNKVLNNNDPMQILKFKSTFSDCQKYFDAQSKKIDDGYVISIPTFKKNDQNIKIAKDIIVKLGTIETEPKIVIKTGYVDSNFLLNICESSSISHLTEKDSNFSRGYKFILKRPIQISSIRIQSDYIGTHIAYIINEAEDIIYKGTAITNDSTMKWLKISLKGEIRNKYSILVYAQSAGGSYAYKAGSTDLRQINNYCSVRSAKVVFANSILNNVVQTSGAINMILQIDQ